MDKQQFFQWLDEYFTQRQEVSISEAARILGISRVTLYKRIETGEITRNKKGRINRNELKTKKS